jgi:hypothetical protein
MKPENNLFNGKYLYNCDFDKPERSVYEITTPVYVKIS